MAIADDLSISSAGDIRWTGTTATYSVLELHRFLQSKADDASYSGDDVLDITDSTPSDRSTDNIISLLAPYNIDDEVSQHLYGGSVTQAAGDEVFSGLQVLGALNNSATTLRIAQNGAMLSSFWGDQSGGGLNGDAAQGVLMRCLIKSRTGGADIDGKRIRVQARHWGDSYAYFNVTLGLGESVAAIQTTPDAQNTTAQGTVTAYTHVTNTEGFQSIDLNNGNGAQPYYAQWTFGADTSGDGLKAIWEYTKDLTGTGTAKTIHGINGELFLGVTHSLAYSAESGGPFQEDEILSWGTNGTAGTGLLLGLDDQGTTGSLYIQLLTGIAPTNGLTIAGGTSSATCTAGAVTARNVPPHFLGSYTGSIIGAYGVGVDAGDLSASDSLEDLLAATQVPPNNVTFSVSALASGEDRVLVGPGSGGALDTAQLSLEASAYSGGEATVTLSAAIPSDTPSAGTFRVFDGSSFKRVAYTGFSGSSFTGCTGMPAAPSSADVFVSYIDELVGASSVSFTAIFSAPRELFVRVRDGGGTPIKTFETPATLGSAGGGVAAIRTSDA